MIVKNFTKPHSNAHTEIEGEQMIEKERLIEILKNKPFTLGQAWEIQCALKDVAKEMTGNNDE